MIDEEKMTFTIPNEQGEQTEYTILFSFISDKTKKHYLVYTDFSTDEDDNLKVLSSILDEENEKISPITTDEELEMVQRKLDIYQKELARIKENEKE